MYYYEIIKVNFGYPANERMDVYEKVASFLNENNIPKENIISIFRVSDYEAKLIYWA